MNRNFTLLSIIAGMLLLVTNSYAMHLNLTLGDDIIANKDRISYAYEVFYKTGGSDLDEQHMQMALDGIYLDKTQEAISGLSAMLASITPVDCITGQHSTLTFGYVKTDGTKVSPASCQNIQARMEMNVVLSEAGCVVS